jgi:hypothetical protein
MNRQVVHDDDVAALKCWNTNMRSAHKRSATSRRDAPDSIASITRARKSLEYGLGIDCPLKIESMPLDSLIDKPLGILPIQPE